ncbi:putative uncharacterized hydrolase [Zancudomyces culisetae]|uniref:Uncharacterized hydrolase n=1 Tax=Zancudomyces culisetae TaxID=1213189 RepID=A0A1R1PKL5_ZANCU|nr:putative uncharacterized hydrolase [Zancudomyces culisetae]|eukprot:OMH81473.1 putative uncharacterized hydrolase [Zancudomyces culisetae]
MPQLSTAFRFFYGIRRKVLSSRVMGSSFHTKNSSNVDENDAPSGKNGNSGANPPKLVKGVVFDKYLQKIKETLGLPLDIPVLESVETLSPEEKVNAFKVILEIENEAMLNMQMRPDNKGIPKAIITNNNIDSVNHMLNTVIPAESNGKKHAFDHIITRDFGILKPDPTLLHHIAGLWNVNSSELLMIGDSMDDMQCGKYAGATSILIKCEYNDAAAPYASVIAESPVDIITFLSQR